METRLSRYELSMLSSHELEAMSERNRSNLAVHSLNTDARVELLADQSAILVELCQRRLGW